MRFILILIILSVQVWSCSSVKNSPTSDINLPLYSKGILPYSTGSFPLSDSSNFGMAKLYKGNNSSGSGAFISDNGLFLTNYSSILDLISTGNDPDFIQKGFTASSINNEIQLQGVSLLIEIEQTDVTDEVQKEITELSPNNEIYRSIQEQKNRILNERRGNRTDLFLEIKDIYSVNRQILSVYQIVRDVRLVFAPSVSLISLKSEELVSKLANEFVILRAYEADNQPKPFEPEFHFSLSEFDSENNEELISLGFPGKTYRLETSRAIEFYHTKLNPYIISFFDIYLNKEDSLADSNDSYAFRSASNRYSVSQNLSFFETAQHVISKHNVLSIKKTDEDQLLQKIKSDTTLPPLYDDLFSKVDQAYDIADQTADILYSTNYFNTLSSLDNLATLYRNYLDNRGNSDSNDDLINQTVASHSQMLQQINTDAELSMLKEFILIFKSIPEEQQPLMIYDLFTGTGSENIKRQSSDYVDNELASSFLLDSEKGLQVLTNDTIFEDPLFSLLEEIAFSFETAQQNFLRHYAYLFPAQQILTRVKMDSDVSKVNTPDSDSFLSYNIGSLSQKTSTHSDYFYTTNDFSGKAPGTAIINQNGYLVGMVGEEINSSILGNYIYSEENSYLKALKTSSILNEIKSSMDKESYIIKELSTQN